MKGKYEIVYMENTFMFFRRTVQNTPWKFSFPNVSSPSLFISNSFSFPSQLACDAFLCCYLPVLTWAYIVLKCAVWKQGIITITIIVIIIIIII